jgi:hypothetical protein
LLAQASERFTVDMIAIALPAIAAAGPVRVSWKNVGSVTKPVQIIENACLKDRSRSRAIVILDSQQDLASRCPRALPDVFGVQHMTEMEPAGRRWGKAGTQGSTGFYKVLQGSFMGA